MATPYDPGTPYDPASPNPQLTYEYDPSSPDMDIVTSSAEQSPLTSPTINPRSEIIKMNEDEDMDELPPLPTKATINLSTQQQPTKKVFATYLDLSSDPIVGTSQLETSRYASCTNNGNPRNSTVPQTKPTAKVSTLTNQANTSNHAPHLRHASKEAILMARDFIIKAYSLTDDREEQSKLLDLLEVFREYTEKGLISKASKIIASQVANLETATRQIETKARDLKKIVTPATPHILSKTSNQPVKQHQQQLQQQQQQQQQIKPSMAMTARKGITQTAGPLEWTVVGKKHSGQQEKKASPSKSKEKTIRRVILVQDPSAHTQFTPLHARNTINKAFSTEGVKGPVVNAVSKTKNGNIAITTTNEYTADFFLEKKDIWKSIIPHQSAQKDQAWFKIVAHGIPITDFDHELGMNAIKDEVVTFNTGLKPIGIPHWISTKESRQIKKSGSVAIAFATEEEANRAIRNRLYIAGISVRVSKFYSVAPSTQCNRCQAYGHLDSYCRKDPKCRLCGADHATETHYCSVCKAKGKTCAHLAPKCVNCTGNHQASSKTCEVYINIKKTAKDDEL